MIKTLLVMIVISIALFFIMKVWLGCMSPLDKLLFSEKGICPSKKSQIFIIITTTIWIVTFIFAIICAIYCIVIF